MEEAIPILEKWFDDVVAGKEKEKEIQEQPVKTEETSDQPETSTQIVNKEQTSQTTTLTEPKIEAPILNQSPEDEQENKKSKFAFLDNIKNIKFKKPSFLEKSSVSKPSLKTNELSKKVTSFFKSKIGKSAVKGEEIVGVEITNKEIRLAQVSTNKSNQWVLDKFYAHPVDLPDDANVLDNGEKLGAELTIALQKSKITTLNAAIAIPVTSAIMLNTNPEGAKLFEIKKKFLILKIYPIVDKNVIIEKIPRHIQAAGTWTYIILTEWLCL